MSEGVIGIKDLRWWGTAEGAAGVLLAIMGLIVEWLPSRVAVIIFAVFEYSLHFVGLVMLVFLSIPMAKVVDNFSFVDVLLYFVPCCAFSLFGILALVATAILAHKIFEVKGAGLSL